MPRERLFLRPEAWYAERKIDLRLGKEARDIDLAAKTVRVGDERLHYDQLAITTGLAARPLPAEMGGTLDGVHTIRTLGDVDMLEAQMKHAQRVLVVGGGYIGLEAAAVARKLGSDVTVIEAAPRILQRVASAETARVMHRIHVEKGVEIREGVGLVSLKGDTHVNAAKLDDGTTIATDLVIVGIGLLPRCAIAEKAGLETDGGVAVDEMGRSSDPHVWAAGDCAAFPFRGERRRIESVQNAIDMGQAVARNMLGANTPYDPVPWFWSDQYDVKLQIAGVNTGYDRVVTRGAGDSVSHWYYEGDTLRAVDAVGDGRAYMVGKRLLEAGMSPSPELVGDPEADLKSLLRP